MYLSCVVSLNALHPLSLCLTLHACRRSPRWSNRSIFSQDSFAALYLQRGREAAAFHSCAKPCWVISRELGEAEGKAAPSQLPLLELHRSTFPLWLWGWCLASFNPTWTLAASYAFSPRWHYAAQNESEAAAKRAWKPAWWLEQRAGNRSSQTLFPKQFCSSVSWGLVPESWVGGIQAHPLRPFTVKQQSP